VISIAESQMKALGDIVEPRREKVSPAKYADLPFIGMEHIEAHTMRLLGTVPAGTMKSTANRFYKGDVLYGRLRPYLNKVYKPNFDGLCSSEFIVLPKTDGIEPDYLKYRLNSHDFVSFTSHLNTGDRPRVDFDQLSSFELFLPSYLDQQRIVAEIEKQFSRLDEAIANLKRVKANLKRYKAAVLKAAVEGRLVETEADLARREGRSYETGEQLLKRILEARRGQWKGKGKYKEPAEPDTTGLPELPEGWVWATWEQVGFSQNGRAFPSSEYCDKGVRLLRPGNLHESGVLIWTTENTRHMPATYAKENAELIVRGRELIMNLTAQSLKDEFLGRICLTSDVEYCLLNQRLARLTPVELLPEFALVVFKSKLFRRFVDGLNTGSLIQHMFTSQLATFAFPLPPLTEQQRIVAEVDRRLSLVRDVEAQADATFKRAERMRLSILMKAFSGGIGG